jgi:hypothetical protein
LKPASGTTRTQVFAAEFFSQLDIAVDEPPATLHNDFRRLRVISKAGEVFKIAMLAHGTPP